MRLLAVLGVILFATTLARAAEVHSNGTGGGLWSDPNTWRTKAVPKPEDSAVISAGDTLVFDQDDDGKTTCADLSIDPGGGLVFKAGGKRTMSLAGPVEAYGTIRVDATGSPDDLIEIRLVGDTPEKRVLRLQQGGSLMVYGRPGLDGGKKNALITCKPPTGSFSDAPGTVAALPGTMLDLQRVQVTDVLVTASGIDNTGSKANEKINISDCAFTGLARAVAISCDTPTIINNTFAYPGEGVIGVPAINVNGSPLAEIRGNHITGKFTYAIMGQNQTDSLVVGNLIENGPYGMYWYGSNAMIKENTIKNCDVGIFVTSMSGLLEDNVIDGAKTGIHVGGATIQVTNPTISNMQKDGVPIDLASGVVTLVNTNLTPEQVKVAGGPPKEGPWVQVMQYLVVGVKGNPPAGTKVEVITKNPATPLKEGAMDMNIRNSPAPLTARMVTPLPNSLQPITVKSWWIGTDGKLQAEPEYTVRLVAPEPGAAADAPPKVLKEITVKPAPSWHRAKANDATPTVEVEVP